MKRNLALAAMVSCALFAAACGSDDSDDTASDEPAATATAEGGRGDAEQHRRAVGVLRAGRLRQAARAARHRARGRSRHAVGADDRARDGRRRRSSRPTKATGWNLCFSNAAVNNPWRQVGWTTMQEEVKHAQGDRELPAPSTPRRRTTSRSPTSRSSANGNCDALIVSPNTTATLTPAVEAACKKVPVIVFDRGVNTDCPVTFVHPIGGYAFGVDGAEFLKENVDAGGKILALRILPGVDVLETRWSGAKVQFDDSELNVVGVEFTDGDAAKTKSIVVRLPPARGPDRRRLDGRRRDRRRRHRGVRGQRPGGPADRRRGPARLPDASGRTTG